MDPRVIEENGVYRSIVFDKLGCKTKDGSSTMLQILQNKVRDSPNIDMLGTIVKENNTLTVKYKTPVEIYENVKNLGSFLETITEDNDIIGIYSVNREEWVVAEYASYLIHCRNCPLFSTFTPDALRKILTETEIKVLVASADKAKSLLVNVLLDDPHNIKHIILIDEDDELIEKFKKINIKAYFLKDILNKKWPTSTRVEPSPDDVATICYTSGTSGNPKGVLLTHKNIMSSVNAFSRNTDKNNYPVLAGDDIYISYLPLPHVFERVCFTTSLYCGIKIAFYSGDPKNLQNDMKLIKPTFIVTVPRVLNIFMEKIKATVEKKNFFIRLLFSLAVSFKCWRIRKTGNYKCWLLDKLVFNKIASEFGGSIRTSLCGGASLNPEVLVFMQAVLCIKIFQGYGQTEGFAANIVLPFNSNKFDSVGIPFGPTEVKLQKIHGYDVSDTGIDMTKGEVGQILMRGNSVTQGYFKKPEETKNAFTDDGWLITGDIGYVENGYFKIIGRIKDVFKTSFGEYIIPEKVENLLTGGIINDIFVTYSQFSDYLLAIVVCLDKSISRQEIIDCINERGKRYVSEKLMARYEIPTYFIIINEPFQELDNGNLITPSLKKRRNFIVEYFKDKISAEFDTK